MTNQIPEYDRGPSSPDGSEEETSSGGGQAGGAGSDRSSAGGTDATRYRADAFRLYCPGESWRDETLYVLSGPTADGKEHRITVTTTSDVEEISTAEFAEAGVEAVLAEFEGARTLLRDIVELHCGRPAHRSIFVCRGSRERLYVEQLYVVCERRGYTLSASFSRASRRHVGTAVEAVMRSFNPLPECPALREQDQPRDTGS